MDLIRMHIILPYYEELVSRGAMAEDNFRNKKAPWAINKASHTETVEHGNQLIAALEPLDMPVAVGLVREILAAFKSGKAGFSRFGRVMAIDLQEQHTLFKASIALRNVFGREFGAKQYYVLTQAEAALIEPVKPLWGQNFESQFPNALDDLDDAAKCLAFGRGTAAVFHLMRIVETGVRAVRACLGIQIPLEGAERNWGVILRRISEDIDQRGKQWRERDKFHEIYVTLNAVKGAWRDSTMHVEKRYEPERAKQIFDVVGGLMQEITSRMDEEGKPLAKP